VQYFLAFLTLLIRTGCVPAESSLYQSRYAEWHPHVGETLVVTFHIGESTAIGKGLWSGSFSAHLLPREPDAVRSDGTFVSGHAVITSDEMKSLLKLADDFGTAENFSIFGDDNWQSPSGNPNWVQVVWRIEEVGYTYDSYALNTKEMLLLLRDSRTKMSNSNAIHVIDGLLMGMGAADHSSDKE
jgi:hypothetical protein